MYATLTDIAVLELRRNPLPRRPGPLILPTLADAEFLLTDVNSTREQVEDTARC